MKKYGMILKGIVIATGLMVLSNVTPVKAYDATYSRDVYRTSGTANIHGVLDVYPDKVYAGLGSDEWCDLSIDGWVSDLEEGA